MSIDMKRILSILVLSGLSVPAVASSQEVSHTTNFSLITKVGNTTSRYSLSEKQRVVMPAGVAWSCNSVPVQLSSDGSIYSAGFICENARGDVISVQSNCYTGRQDHERNTMSVTTNDDNTGIIRFITECVTEADGTAPSIRRS